MFITSQRFIDDETVEAKREAGDYVVTVTPEFEVDGVVMQAIIDGHHSLAAARADDVEPEYVVATAQDDDRVGLILDGRIEDYLEASFMDSDWYDVETGHNVF